MELYHFIKPLGITTYIFIFITVMLGLFRTKLPFKVSFKLHILLGIISLILATAHEIIVSLVS